MDDDPDTPLIQLRGVTKTFGSGAASFQALRGVDFEVKTGDFVAVMGPSGSGKSTMMNILGCLDVPTTGEFLFQGIANTFVQTYDIAQADTFAVRRIYNNNSRIAGRRLYG